MVEEKPETKNVDAILSPLIGINGFSGLAWIILGLLGIWIENFALLMCLLITLNLILLVLPYPKKLLKIVLLIFVILFLAPALSFLILTLKWGLLLGTFLMIFAFLVSSLRIIQKPEVWIIERLGVYNRTLEAGLRLIIPIIETIREKIRVWEQPISIFATQPKIDFRDGAATLKDPKTYVELSKENPQDAIYKVKNWKKWIEDAIEPIIRGYLNTLSIREALDEGRARGDLIDRLKDAPTITGKRLRGVGEEIQILQGEITNSAEEKARPLKLLKQGLEQQKRELEIRLEDQRRLKRAFTKLEKDAKARGIEKIHRVAVAEYGLDENVVRVRQRVLEERRKAEAAVFEAMREATLRTESIRQAKERLVEIGYSEQDALDKAYTLEVLETLANTGSLFITEESGIAGLTGIISEVLKRRGSKSKK